MDGVEHRYILGKGGAYHICRERLPTDTAGTANGWIRMCFYTLHWTDAFVPGDSFKVGFFVPENSPVCKTCLEYLLAEERTKL